MLLCALLQLLVGCSPAARLADLPDACINCVVLIVGSDAAFDGARPDGDLDAAPADMEPDMMSPSGLPTIVDLPDRPPIISSPEPEPEPEPEAGLGDSCETPPDESPPLEACGPRPGGPSGCIERRPRLVCIEDTYQKEENCKLKAPPFCVGDSAPRGLPQPAEAPLVGDYPTCAASPDCHTAFGFWRRPDDEVPDDAVPVRRFVARLSAGAREAEDQPQIQPLIYAIDRRVCGCGERGDLGTSELVERACRGGLDPDLEPRVGSIFVELREGLSALAIGVRATVVTDACSGPIDFEAVAIDPTGGGAKWLSWGGVQGDGDERRLGGNDLCPKRVWRPGSERYCNYGSDGAPLGGDPGDQPCPARDDVRWTHPAHCLDNDSPHRSVEVPWRDMEAAGLADATVKGVLLAEHSDDPGLRDVDWWSVTLPSTDERPLFSARDEIELRVVAHASAPAMPDLPEGYRVHLGDRIGVVFQAACLGCSGDGCQPLGAFCDEPLPTSEASLFSTCAATAGGVRGATRLLRTGDYDEAECRSAADGPAGTLLFRVGVQRQPGGMFDCEACADCEMRGDCAGCEACEEWAHRLDSQPIEYSLYITPSNLAPPNVQEE